MATYVPFMPIPIQLQNGSGDNLSGGSLEFYLSGTTTPTNLYSNNSGTSIGSSITLNASGYPESGGNVITLFRDSAVAIKIVAKDSGSATVWTADTLDGTLVVLPSNATGKGASLIGIEDAAGDYTATDVEAALAEIAANYLKDIVDDTTPTLGGNLDCDDLEVQKAVFKDISGVVSSPSSVSGVLTLDFEDGNIFDVTLTENVTSIVISNWPATGSYAWLKIRFQQDSTGSWTVAGWPTAVDAGWLGGAGPTVTTTATTGRDWIELVSLDAGTQVEGHFGQDYS